MDWAHDDAYLSNTFVRTPNLFKHTVQATVVLKMVQSNKYEVQIWCLETDAQWEEWLQHNAGKDQRDDGLILILAKRAGEGRSAPIRTLPVTATEWLEKQEIPEQPVKIRRADTLAPLGENRHTRSPTHHIAPVKRQESVRTLPFSDVTFYRICEKFQVHESIVRTISRSDVPVFACENVTMGQPAYVYNCRTSNSWDLDLALSATYFPVSGMTYGIVYGCPLEIEKTILRRLSSVKGKPIHPLLLPGIIAEIESGRHARIVDRSINEVEAKIYELDSQPNMFQSLQRAEIEKRNEAKRSAWLDLTYLRNSLQTWNSQLRTMSNHTIELDTRVFTKSSRLSKQVSMACACKASTVRRTRSQSHANTLVDFGSKIKRRLDTLESEYEERIRDCTMRIDGMAMATQWAHGETAAEMATATNKESNVMKSISLVTMIFLPGTFFATVFSMTFFDWKSDSGERVSSYLWIYVVVTVLFTTITIGLWYYFVIHRRKSRKTSEEC